MSETMIETRVRDLRETEDDRVLQWRVGRLLEAGYSGEAALIIGLDHGIDLHRATGMLAAGCPHDTALRILF